MSHLGIKSGRAFLLLEREPKPLNTNRKRPPQVYGRAHNCFIVFNRYFRLFSNTVVSRLLCSYVRRGDYSGRMSSSRPIL